DIDVEIEKKLKKGYPSDNILFEDSITAVLLQNGSECLRAEMRNSEELDKLIRRFVEFERPELQSFRLAIDQFKQDLPEVFTALRDLISAHLKTNKPFKTGLNTFLKLCQDSINKTIVLDDVREMLIQHILTEDIFYTVFNDTQFHRENNIARELQKVAETFFTGATKKNTLKRLESYYGAIKQSASGIANHHEKQKFLKAIYENFYKIYNPKMADRLGVVYTPNEIVRFMIESTESLVHKHFNKLLSSKSVEILDPATGTGTFMTDLIEHFKGDKKALEYKYKNELHCNEVAILPYYIANLNIEFTYSQIMGEYAEFPHICFVDTLDNLGFKQEHTGRIEDLFSAGMTAENTERVKKQNAKKISVVLGNPPYNANQLNENDNNKNRTYDGIDKRIKDTYIHESTAQKTKLYDMYSRFFRWASDGLDENGVIAFITNRSFIDSRTFDGFRKTVANEFNEIHIVDLGGDVRANPKLSGTTHNVFGIQTGVAISFLVKNRKSKGCRICYARRPEMEIADDKLSYLAETKLDTIEFETITPDKNNNWINLADNDFESLIPIANKETKAVKSQAKENAIFKLFSLGVVTARDEWAYDDDEKALNKKIDFLIKSYNHDVKKLSLKSNKKDITDELATDFKWTRAVKNDLKKGISYEFNKDLIQESLYRPFVKKQLYFSKQLNEMQYQLNLMFKNAGNIAISFLCVSSENKLAAMAVNCNFDYCCLKMGNGGTQAVSYWAYDKDGNRTDNITDWGLSQFTKHYAKLKTPITKLAIFHYVYAVLHDPIYREKYALNLKREFPRIPFYADFWQWAGWGEALMNAHIGYENVKPTKLKRVDQAIKNPKAKLKADKENGLIILDEATTLSGVPAAAWDYKLGNRSGLEWVLDQYKESKPKDPTIREKFNTYRFADYKEHVIDLLARVCTVSVETQKIVEDMKNLSR
ncbi:MAG: type ISP restriction/modification enzyme, partial [Burkholderiales bacterium]